MNKVIALVDPYFKGHHLTYMKLFVTCLLNKGYKVCVLIPQNDEIDDFVRSSLPEYTNNFFSSDIDNKEFTSFLPSVINRYFSTLYRWFYIKKKLVNIENTYKIKVDFVFFAWLDSFLFKYIPHFFVNKIFPYNWSGLYFQPNHIRLNTFKHNHKTTFFDRDYILSTKSCKSVALLDSFICNQLGNRINKNVISFPDIINTDFDKSNGIAESIKAKSLGRRIVGIIGLEKRKGVLEMIQLAKNTDEKKFFYVFAGEINYAEYTLEQKNLIKSYFNGNKENKFLYLGYISQDSTYNSIFRTFDIAFVVYQNFLTSSNMLTKAAYFDKLVIAVNKYYIGDTVLKFKLGEVTHENDLAEHLKALHFLNDNYEKYLTQNETLRKAFYQQNSLQKLNESFDQIIKLNN
ncbi:MAG: hypothetical protein ACEQSR_06515 [Candidatus Methylacidiphilales bacterium]